MGTCPIALLLALVSGTDAMVAGANSIIFRSARRVSIATETPDQDGKDALRGGVYAASLGLESTCSGSARHSAAILDTGASANLVGVNWLNHHNGIGIGATVG